MKKVLIGTISVMFIISISSCGIIDDTTNLYKAIFELILPPKEYTEHIYGFWGGLFHGAFIWLSLIAKLFGFKIGLYAEHTTGFTYWLGYVIGILFLGGGANSRR